ncbi:MAG: radical SAM protein [Anaerolineae bacterium]|nr:radical SAM protein [Anaerolineae bacterium]
MSPRPHLAPGASGEAKRLFNLPWPELQGAAWTVRHAYHPPELRFAVPGGKRYATEHYRNTPWRFASISLTGRHCDLQCEHCRGRMLATMLPALTPEMLVLQAERLLERGCAGVLISGGCNLDGAVPIKPYLSAIARVRSMGLRTIVHTGLLDRETAEGLKNAGVDQVLLDVVGDEETIQQVLHLTHSPAEYEATLALARAAGLSVAPHVIVGLHCGELRGELAALEIIRRTGADVVVIVVLRPLPHTPLAQAPVMAPDTVGRLVAVARLLFPAVPVTLGCARPAGPLKAEMERLAVLAGINGLAYPDPATVELAAGLGLRTSFVESCCTLAVTSQ